MIGRVVLAAVIGGGIGASAVSAVQMMRAPDTAAETLAKHWMDMHARCQKAIETSQPLATDGLSSVTALRRDGIERVMPDGHAAWRGADERIALIDIAPNALNGHTRGCKVELADDMFGVHPDASGRILTEFLGQRSARSAEGTHYDADPAPITPGFGLGYDAAVPNPDGCLTTTVAFFDPERGVTQTSTTEKLDLPCRERSENKNDGASHA